jgi:DNA topoisomerase VI subunit B
MECVDSKEDALIQTGRIHQNINSAVLQTARRLKTEVQRGTRHKGHHNRENKEKRRGMTMHESFHLTQMKTGP